MSLARVGSRAALSFAFAFLRRAWRSGEDSDLCCDLLQESLDALRALPEATLYDEKSVSAVWIDTVDRATKFVRNVVEGCEPLQAFHFLFLNILHTKWRFLRSGISTRVEPPQLEQECQLSTSSSRWRSTVRWRCSALHYVTSSTWFSSCSTSGTGVCLFVYVTTAYNTDSSM